MSSFTTSPPMQGAAFHSAALALLAALAAQAQEPPASPVSPTPAAAQSAADAQTDVSATASLFKPGMTVKDSAGVTVGQVAQVGTTVDGEAAVVVTVDGKRVSLAPSVLSLTPAGDQALSSMTKAEIVRRRLAGPDG